MLPTKVPARLAQAPLRSFRRIQNLIPLHDSNLGILLYTLSVRLWRSLRPLRNALVVAAGIDTENATDVVAVAWDREFAERISPLVEEGADGFSYFVLAVFGVVPCASDGVDWPG